MQGKKLARLAGRLLVALLALVLLAFLYVTLVVGQPQEAPAEATATPPPLTAQPDVQITSENDLPTLLRAFPVPVMSFMSGSGMTFLSGTCADTPWEGAVARVITLRWRTAEGEEVILRSICPAQALSLLGGEGFSFSAKAGPVLFGQTSVRMENGTLLRLHTVAGQGLYALTVPMSLSDSLSLLTRPVQLFRTE